MLFIPGAAFSARQSVPFCMVCRSTAVMHLISLCIFHEIHAQKTAKCRAKILPCSIDNSPFFRYHIYIKKERQGKLYEKKEFSAWF